VQGLFTIMNPIKLQLREFSLGSRSAVKSLWTPVI